MKVDPDKLVHQKKSLRYNGCPIIFLLYFSFRVSLKRGKEENITLSRIWICSPWTQDLRRPTWVRPGRNQDQKGFVYNLDPGSWPLVGRRHGRKSDTNSVSPGVLRWGVFTGTRTKDSDTTGGGVQIGRYSSEKRSHERESGFYTGSFPRRVLYSYLESKRPTSQVCTHSLLGVEFSSSVPSFSSPRPVSYLG